MRQDIQCLRGIAISFVFLYHLFPTLFVNGFLGVDIFFVISGFLMAKNLTHNRISGVSDILQFYYKRLKRILPLYYLITLITLVLVHFYLGDFFWKTNKRYCLASLFLVTNQLVIHDSQDYFIPSRRFIPKCIPSLMVLISRDTVLPSRSIHLIWPAISENRHSKTDNSHYHYSVFIPFTQVNSHFAFNFMFLRLWQFSTGFIAFYWTRVFEKSIGDVKKETQAPGVFSKEDLMVMCLVLISLSLVPNKINVLFLRPLVTFSTAIIIAAGSQENQILKSKSLAYLGNVSYTFYLIHWPVICLFSGNPIRSYIFCGVATIISSALIYHLYEKVYLKLDKTPIFLLTVFLIFSNAFLQYSTQNHNFWTQKFTSEVQNIIDQNKVFLEIPWESHPFNEQCFDDKNPEPMDPFVRANMLRNCHLKKGTGNTSVLVIGNSYSLNMVGRIHEKFHRNYSDFRYLGIISCSGLYAHRDETRKIMDFHRRHVETYKPDVLIIVSRHLDLLNERIEDEDDFVKQMNENIAFYEKFVKRVYILGSHPLYKLNFLSNFLHFLTQKPDEMESLHLNKMASDNFMRNTMKRLKMVKCQRCQIFDLSWVFVEGDKYLTFDRENMLTFVDNGIHFTTHGLERMDPAFEKLRRDIMS